MASWKVDFQVSSSGTLAGSFAALVLRQFWKERQKSVIHNDVRHAVVAASELEVQAAAAFEGTLADASSRVRSGIWEAQKVQPEKSTNQFFVKEKVGTSTCVVKGHVEEVLDGVIGGGGLGDVYGKWVDLYSMLSACGVTVHLHARMRGGSREHVPGQWTCSICHAQRCWPVRTRCHRCREPRVDAPPRKSKGKGTGKSEGPQGPLGWKPPAVAGVVPPTVSDIKKIQRLKRKNGKMKKMEK